MTLSVTTIQDNIQAPMIQADAFQPDQLVVDAKSAVTQPATIGQVSGGAQYQRGQVMGQVTATGKWIPSISSANDGSQLPKGILYRPVSTTGGDATGDLYVSGEFNSQALTYDSSFTTIQALVNAMVAPMFVKITAAGLSNSAET